MTHRLITRGLAIVLVALTAACTMTKQEAPDLSGPSEFSTSVAVAISPDVLPQDGASQSVITLTARDAQGQPLRNLGLRVEIRVDGTPRDLGTLSARSVVTGTDGRATIVYTAPSSPTIAVDPFTIVEIVATPIGSDFNNTQARSASMRLVPTGPVAPPDGLQPAFTFTPSNPSDHQRVLFDASTSQAPTNNPIVTYSWSFGDGGTGTGRTATHDYSFPGTYIVTLTIIDGFGRSAATSQSLSVGAGVESVGGVHVLTDRPGAWIHGELQRVGQPRRARTHDRQLCVGLRRRHVRHRRAGVAQVSGPRQLHRHARGAG